MNSVKSSADAFPFWNPIARAAGSRPEPQFGGKPIIGNYLERMSRFGTQRVLEGDRLAQQRKGTNMAATGTLADRGAERRRMEAVIETLASIHPHGESVSELAHDARNMVTALSLYCDLLEEPGVLESAHRHYASELRLVTEASRRLVEKLAQLDDEEAPCRGTISALQASLFPESAEVPRAAGARRSEINSGALNSTLHMEPVSSGLIEDFR